MSKVKINSILYALFFFVYICIYISDDLKYGSFILLTLILVSAALNLIKNRGRFIIDNITIIVYMICFIAFCAISRIWAAEPSYITPKIISLMIALIIIMMFSSVFSKNEEGVDALLKIIMYGGYLVIVYFALRYGFDELINSMNSGDRLSSDLINSNSLGMCAAYSMIINFYYIAYKGFNKKDFLLFPALIIVGLSGSRKALVLLLGGFLGILVLKNRKNDIVKKFGFTLLIIIISICVFYILSKLSIFSTTINRLQNLISLIGGNETRYTSDAWIRLAYNRLGLRLFKEHPLLGIGIANSPIYTHIYYGHYHYLHNNFVEILACGGLVGFIIYYSIYIYLIKRYIKLKGYKSKEYDICVLLLGLRLIMNFGAVSYYNKETYIYLLLFILETEVLKKNSKHLELKINNMSVFRR